MSIFDYNNAPNYTTPVQNRNYTIAGSGIGNNYYQNPQAYKPVAPSQQHAATGAYQGTLQQLANVQAPNYVGEFSNYYNDLMNKLNNMSGNQQGATNAGLGQYDIGNAGQGQYKVGDAGLGMFDYQNSPLANYQISPIGSNIGTGLYDSDLLKQLAGRVSSNLANPDASLAMGLARDQIQGQGLGARQQLTDSFAGLGGRGQGPAQAQMSQLGNTLNQQQSDAYRNIAMDTEKRAIEQAQALEQMRGGFYNTQQGNQLQNAALNQQGQIAQGDIYKNLANIGSSAYSDAQSRALQNAGMGQSAYQDAMSRQLQGATLGADTFNQARQRELSNAQLNNQMYQQGLGNSSQIAGYMAGLLPNMADFLKNQGNLDMSAQNQTYGNYQGLNADDIARKGQERAYDQQYQQDYQNWLQQMEQWKSGTSGRQF